MNKSFEDLFNNIDQGKITEQWNEVKKDNNRLNKISLIIILIVDLIIIFAAMSKITINPPSILLGTAGLTIFDLSIYVIISVFGSKSKKKYNDIFKSEIIEKILSNFFNDVDYIPLKPMPSSIYNEGKYESYDEYCSDDYMEGKIDDKYPIKMAEVLTEEEYTTTDADGNTTTTTITLFSGLFAKINLDKSINNEFKIGTNNSISKKKRLEMDSSEFERYFDVSSTNKIIGMQILTHDIMELLVNYRKEQGKSFDILIRNDIMYIRFYSGPMFEAKINKESPIDKQTVEKYYNTVKFIHTLSKLIIKVINETEI